MSFLAWPLETNRIRRDVPNNTFGTVRRNADGTNRDHQGWDLVATPLTACYAIAEGVIRRVRDEGPKGHGKTLVLEFSFQGRTLYALYSHLSLFNVVAGNKVAQGEIIAYTGTSGNARGMTGEDQHLHFEIRTEEFAGPGLGGRINPEELYGRAPRGVTIVESHAQKRLLSGSTGLKIHATDMRRW
ncbi:MAG: M23 family metallopeptidase [Acidovorax sp.]|nr:MAG: M23 family metallopeptidase [Acidovorax sp.]